MDIHRGSLIINEEPDNVHRGSLLINDGHRGSLLVHDDADVIINDDDGGFTVKGGKFLVAAAARLPAGWTQQESRSRPGQFTYVNMYTNERISWLPTVPASRTPDDLPPEPSDSEDSEDDEPEPPVNRNKITRGRRRSIHRRTRCTLGGGGELDLAAIAAEAAGDDASAPFKALVKTGPPKPPPHVAALDGRAAAAAQAADKDPLLGGLFEVLENLVAMRLLRKSKLDVGAMAKAISADVFLREKGWLSKAQHWEACDKFRLVHGYAVVHAGGRLAKTRKVALANPREHPPKFWRDGGYYHAEIARVPEGGAHAKGKGRKGRHATKYPP